MPLKKRRKPENLLPDVPAPNVHAIKGQVINAKKKSVDVIRKFANIGIMDAAESHNPELPHQNVHAYSITNQVKDL